MNASTSAGSTLNTLIRVTEPSGLENICSRNVTNLSISLNCTAITNLHHEAAETRTIPTPSPMESERLTLLSAARLAHRCSVIFDNHLSSNGLVVFPESKARPTPSRARKLGQRTA